MSTTMLKKAFVPLLFCVFFITHVYSQKVDYKRVIPPANATNLAFQEKLVQLAWQNYPQNEILKAQLVKAKKEIHIARWAWLDNFSATGNLNELTINPQENVQNPLFFPRYNFGVRFTPGMLVRMPAETKIAKENYKIASLNLDDQKLNIRAIVLKLYQEYVMQQKLVELETQTLEVILTDYQLAEEKFKKGNATLEEYQDALTNYADQQRQQIMAESNFIKAKIDLEAIIGVPLEEVK